MTGAKGYDMERPRRGVKPLVVNLSPMAFPGMTEKLRSGVNGKALEAIEQSVEEILVGVDGCLTIEAKTGGLLGLDENISLVDCQEGWSLLEHDLVLPAGDYGESTTAA